MVFIVLFFAAYFLINYLTARKMEEIANMKGHSDYFWWCFWLGLAGWLMVVALPDRRLELELPELSAPAQRQKAEAPKQAASPADDHLPEL